MMSKKVYLLLYLFLIIIKGYSFEIENPIRFQIELSTHYPGEEPNQIMEKDWGVLILPKNYTENGLPVPLVIACHGGGGTVHSKGSQVESLDMYRYLISLGYAVMDMAGMPETYSERLMIDHRRCMGSFIAVRSYELGYKWVVDNFNIDSNGCYLAGGSNGGLTATNLVSHSNIPFVCQAATSPLLSMKDQAWDVPFGANSGGQFPAYQARSNIIRIYGMKDVKGYNEILVTKYDSSRVGDYDPFVYKVSWHSGVMRKVYSCPIKIWHPIDDNVLPIIYSRMFVDAVNTAGGEAHLEELSGGGHDPHLFGKVLGYFYYNNRKRPIKKVTLEQAIWFGKFSGIQTKVICN